MARTLQARQKDLGGFNVTRVLPHKDQRMVGPFVFFDRMGPATFPSGSGVNVRPHPHIGLATITYLFEGSILHRDSLSNVQEIFPGDVNWMTAGSGIVHSERETLEVRGSEHRLHGIQTWLALPEDKAHIDPSFTHIKKTDLPCILREKVMMRLIAGDAYQRTSPINVHSPTFYLDVVTEPGALVERPDDKMETACLVIEGEIAISGNTYKTDDFIILETGDEKIESTDHARYILLGGEAFAKQPHLFWNFVAFDQKDIEQAKIRWQQGQFPVIPGDDEEHIPLP